MYTGGIFWMEMRPGGKDEDSVREVGGGGGGGGG